MDVRTATQAIEAEVDPGKKKEGVRQLQGTDRARYLAVPKQLAKDALDYTQGTDVGVMNEHGRIRKRAQ